MAWKGAKEKRETFVVSVASHAVVGITYTELITSATSLQLVQVILF
jgi:hypothetical protein